MIEVGKLILEIIENSGGQARFVGGCVRDFICGAKIKDVDIATSLKPEIVTHIFESKGFSVIPTGIKFGTVTVMFNNSPYEVTTLRKDMKCFGRHAEVEFSESFEEDSLRRDFTFNALYMDRAGEIYDFHNGREDLKNGIVRFIGNSEERIKEDYLRILRLFRFQVRFGKAPIIATQLQACEKNIEGMKSLSGERIHDEMKKILEEKNSLPALQEMFSCKVLQAILNLENNFFEFDNLKKYFEVSKNPSWIASLVSMLNTKEVTSHLIKIKSLVSGLKFSNIEKVLFYRLWESLNSNYHDDYELRKLVRATETEEFRQCVYVAVAKGFLAVDYGAEIIQKAESFVVPEFPINGMDLMNELRMRPGKEMGELLRKFEELWERENYTLTRDEMLKMIRGG